MAIEFDFRKYPGRKSSNIRRDHGDPLISIITPYYNDRDIIWDTCQSVVNQTFPWFEWIIVDDGSDDEYTLKTLKEIEAFDDRIIILRQENRGIGAARNYGIKNAKADYIQILDGDDLLEPVYLEYCYRMLENNPEAAFACTSFCVFGDEKYIVDEPFDSLRQLNENQLLPEALIRREWIDKIGGYTEEPKIFYEDWDFWLRLMAAGGTCVKSGKEVLCWYRRRKNGLLAYIRNDKSLEDRCKEIIEEDRKYIYMMHEPVMFPDSGNEPHTVHGPKKNTFDRKMFSDDKISVLFLFHWFSRGGADRFNIDLINGLDREKYHVTVATTLRGENEWLQRARENTDDIFNLPNFMTSSDYPEFIGYLIDTRDVDIIFIDISIAGYCMLPWIRKEYPRVAVVDYLHMVERFWRIGGYAGISAVLSSFIDHTYVCNSVTGSELCREFGRKKEDVSTVYIGVDTDWFKRGRIREGILHEMLNIERHRPIVLFPCRICPQKRPMLMLKIAKMLVEEIPDVAFVVAGDGEDLERMKGSTYNMGLTDNVYYIGAQEEMRPYYQDASVTLICSISEGLTLTAYESLAMGVPVVSADVGGQRDLIDSKVGAIIPLMQDEIKDYNSIFFKKEEVKAYSDALYRLLTNDTLRAEASKEGRKRVEDKFSTSAMIAYFDNELERIVRDKELKRKRESVSNAMALLNDMPGEYYRYFLMAEFGIHPDIAGKEKPEHPIRVDRGMVEGPLPEKQPDLGEIRQILIEHDKYIRSHEQVITRHEEVVNRHEEVVNRHEEVVNRHEEVVNRHEEVVNRHEEVVNRHEASINHQWEVQKWHEDRISILENKKCFCPCCGRRFDAFREGYWANSRDVDTRRYKTQKQDVVCPECWSLPRHRILAMWMNEHKDMLAGKRILYFAPVKPGNLWFDRNGIKATTADLYNEADLKLDVQNIDQPDKSWDVIICNHVLEHVDDHKKAIKEMKRIMSDDGIMILSFPVDDRYDTVYEDPSKTTDKQRIRAFGQNDHKRIFGRDSMEMLSRSGFKVEEISGAGMPAEIAPFTGPADYDINILYLCRKAENTLEP